MCKEFFEGKNQSEKINQKLFEVYHLKSVGKNFKLIKRKLTFAVFIITVFTATTLQDRETQTEKSYL